jgi:hypothetical protein
MTATPTSIDNKTTKVKRPREEWFCIFLLFFFLGFVLWWVLFFYVFVKLKLFFITKNLLLILKLNTIESFYYIEKDFVTILDFLGCCHSFREIMNEEFIYIYIYIYKCIVSVNMSILNG